VERTQEFILKDYGTFETSNLSTFQIFPQWGRSVKVSPEEGTSSIMFFWQLTSRRTGADEGTQTKQRTGRNSFKGKRKKKMVFRGRQTFRTPQRLYRASLTQSAWASFVPASSFGLCPRLTSWNPSPPLEGPRCRGITAFWNGKSLVVEAGGSAAGPRKTLTLQRRASPDFRESRLRNSSRQVPGVICHGGKRPAVQSGLELKTV